MYTIGKLAGRARVDSDSIRFYERQGLISPTNKTDSSYRLYRENAVRRIGFIKHAQGCGFSLAEIGTLLQLHRGDPTARADGWKLAQKKKVQLRETMLALQAMTSLLDAEERARILSFADESPLVDALENGLPEETGRS